MRSVFEVGKEKGLIEEIELLSQRQEDAEEAKRIELEEKVLREFEKMSMALS